MYVRGRWGVVVRPQIGWHGLVDLGFTLPVPRPVQRCPPLPPPCTPELQPVEPFWPIVREAVANRSIGRIDRLRARLEYRTRNPSVVQPRIGFRWVRSIEQ
ncbi:hypothetical protein [Gemmata massiliana]|uniref:hypothetical protein n=1 Tax=Gemmata massiliana TaxID=1210884 RepID=UPI001E57FD9E|nr:hypothetical protein [Gemmata massiliana]